CVILAPEHPLNEKLLDPAAKARAKEMVDGRANQDPGEIDKQGFFTGHYAVNPFGGESIPIWVGNFVLMGYGTGAIMAVPAHDQRDFEFARKYGLPVRVVIQPDGQALDGATMPAAYEGSGKLVNSGPFDGLDSEEAIRRMTSHAETHGVGKGTVTYRLKDWL